MDVSDRLVRPVGAEAVTEPRELREGDWQRIERRAKTCAMCGKEFVAELPECACGTCNRHLCADCGRTCQDELWHPDCADKVAMRAEESADAYESFARSIKAEVLTLRASLRAAENPMRDWDNPSLSIVEVIRKSREESDTWKRYARQMRGKGK